MSTRLVRYFTIALIVVSLCSCKMITKWSGVCGDSRISASSLLSASDLPAEWKITGTRNYPTFVQMYNNICVSMINLKNGARNRHNWGWIIVETYSSSENAQSSLNTSVADIDNETCSRTKTLQWVNDYADEVRMRVCFPHDAKDTGEQTFMYAARYTNKVIKLSLDFIDNESALEECYRLAHVIDLNAITLLK